MRLFTFRHSPNPLKVRIAMVELGLTYEAVEVSLFKGEHMGGELGLLNPFESVPVLEDEGRVLRESNAILAWLGKRSGKALWPRDPSIEAQALQWLFFESAHLAGSCGALWWNDVVVERIGRPKWATPEAAREAHAELPEFLDVLEQHFKNNRYVLGQEFSLVDCSLGVTLNLLRGTRLDQPERWRWIHDYSDAIVDRPSWSVADGWAIHKF